MDELIAWVGRRGGWLGADVYRHMSRARGDRDPGGPVRPLVQRRRGAPDRGPPELHGPRRRASPLPCHRDLTSLCDSRLSLPQPRRALWRLGQRQVLALVYNIIVRIRTESGPQSPGTATFDDHIKPRAELNRTEFTR